MFKIETVRRIRNPKRRYNDSLVTVVDNALYFSKICERKTLSKTDRLST